MSLCVHVFPVTHTLMVWVFCSVWLWPFERLCSTEQTRSIWWCLSSIPYRPARGHTLMQPETGVREREGKGEKDEGKREREGEGGREEGREGE